MDDKNYAYFKDNQINKGLLFIKFCRFSFIYFMLQAKKSSKKLNKKYYTSNHKHPLIFMDRNLHNGQACDGRKLKEKFFSRIT